MYTATNVDSEYESKVGDPNQTRSEKHNKKDAQDNSENTPSTEITELSLNQGATKHQKEMTIYQWKENNTEACQYS
jgi:hypothetical protein